MTEKNYPVNFTPPGTDERGAPKGAALLRALAAEPVQEDGYAYVSLGPAARRELERLAGVHASVFGDPGAPALYGESFKTTGDVVCGSESGAALLLRQGPVQEGSEIQRLRLEVTQLRARLDALEGKAGKQVDLPATQAEVERIIGRAMEAASLRAQAEGAARRRVQHEESRQWREYEANIRELVEARCYNEGFEAAVRGMLARATFGVPALGRKPMPLGAERLCFVDDEGAIRA